MTIRKIAPEEHMEILKIRSVSYNSRKDFSDPEKVKKGYETIRALFDDSGKPCATTCLEPYVVNYNGNTVKMGGIGAVATLPQERNKGYVRDIFRYCFDEMRENEQWFSYLFPFSHPYYRMYGYECCNVRRSVNIPLNAFSELKYPGRAVLFEFDKHLDIVKEIYAKFIADKNLAVIRNDAWWENIFKKDPYTQLCSTYIWYNEHEEPVAYIAYDASNEVQNEINATEIAFTDYNGLRGLLGFLTKFYPVFKAFKGQLPGFLDMTMIVPEPKLIQCELCPSGMNRITDVARVLALTAPPAQNAQVNIEVSDNFLDWNNGVFSLSFEDSTASVKATTAAADLRCNVQSLVRFATGYCSLKKAVDFRTAEVSDKHDLLFSLFPEKDVFMTEGF